MKIKLNLLISSLALCCFIFPSSMAEAAADHAVGSFIAADNHLIQYVGRVDFDNPKAPVLYWSGSYIRAQFQGSSVSAILNDQTGQNTYHVSIDDSNGFTLFCKQGSHVYQLGHNLAEDKNHEVLIYKRTEYELGQTTFEGFILDQGKNFVHPLYRPARRIEFYGDSITCAMGNEDESRINNSDMNLENNYMSYAAMTARNLKAEHVCIAKSGIGFMVSWAPVIMPEIYDRLNPVDSESKWNFSKWTPDVVVVNLGTNDNWLYKRLDPIPTSDEIIKSYTDFIRKLRDKYPDAHIFCTLGNMDSTQETSPFPGYIESAVEFLKTRYNDQKISIVIFPYKKTEAHPTISEHKMMADQLTEKIKQVMKW